MNKREERGMNTKSMTDQELRDAEWAIEHFLNYTDEADTTKAEAAYTEVVAELQRRGVQS